GWSRLGGGGHARRRDAILAEKMEHRPARGDQVIRYDPPMTPPPEGFGTHDGARLRLSQCAQPDEAGMENLSQGVVRIIVKTLVLPECIHAWRNVPLLAAQAAQRGDVLISDLKLRQRLGQLIAVVLRVRARA